MAEYLHRATAPIAKEQATHYYALLKVSPEPTTKRPHGWVIPGASSVTCNFEVTRPHDLKVKTALIYTGLPQ